MKLPRNFLGRVLFFSEQSLKAAPQSNTPLDRQNVLGFIGTGHSLSDGVGGFFYTADDQQTYGNLKLFDRANAYALSQPNATSLVAAPLQEPFRPLLANASGEYPQNVYGQTPHHAMADQLSALAIADNTSAISAHTLVGEGGRSITSIEKNGTESTGSKSPAYAASLFEAHAFRRLTSLQGQTYEVGAIVLTHGETDASRETYARDVMNMIYDYQADLSAITGQTRNIPVILSQQNTLGPGGNAASALNVSTFSWSRYAAFKMATDYPLDAIVSGPKYQYAYWLDHLHLTQPSYRRLGEKYAQVAYETVVKQNAWLPTMPLFASLAGNTTLTLPYHAPVSPLQWDDDLPSPHGSGSRWSFWGPGRGFEVFNGDTTPVQITGVRILANDSVQITTAVALTGIPRVQYAMTQDGDTNWPQGNLATGSIGQLTDSDPFVGIDSNQYTFAPGANDTIIGCSEPVLDHDVGDTVLNARGAVLGRLEQRLSNTTFALDRPYRGSNNETLTFRFNHQNYAVASSQPVLFTPVVNGVLPKQWVRASYSSNSGWQGVCAAFVAGQWLSGAAGTDGICRTALNGAAMAQTTFQLLTQVTANTSWVNTTRGVAPGALLTGSNNHQPIYACRVDLGNQESVVGQLLFDLSSKAGTCHFVRSGNANASGTYQTLAIGDGLSDTTPGVLQVNGPTSAPTSDPVPSGCAPRFRYRDLLMLTPGLIALQTLRSL